MALLVLRITDDCNFSCKYCYVKKEKNYMDFSTAKQALDYFASKYGDFKIQITGGEPLLNFDLIMDIVKYLEEKNISSPINIQSNGSLLDQEKVRKIKEHKINISLSLDAYGDLNKSLRPMKNSVESSFYLVDQAIDLLAKNKMETQINAVLTAENVGAIDKLIDYCLLKGNVRGLSIDNLRPINLGSNLRPANKDQVLALLNRIEEKLISYYQAGIDFEFRDFSKMIYILSKDIKRESYCYAQTDKSIALMPNGDCYPCSSLAGYKDFCYGNIGDGLEEIKLFPKLQDLNDACKSCSIKSYCCGACPAGRLSGFNEIDCTIKKFSYVYGKKFLENLRR